MSDSRARRGSRVPGALRLGRLDAKVSPYLYIAPFFILFAIVGLAPLAYNLVVSLYDWDLIGGQGDFVGLQNFVDVLGQRGFYVALRNTVSIFLLSSIPQIAVALVLAALLSANLRARSFWRMGVLVPYVVAPVAVALVFGQLFADQYGLFNTALTAIGLDPVPWHSSVLGSHLAIASMVNFRWTGYNTLVLLAAMQAIPEDVYEAAVLDGAGRVRQFLSITLPMVRPTMIFVVITSTIGGLQLFDEPQMFDPSSSGGSDQQWQTLTMYLWKTGWGNRDLGGAGAIAWLLFLVIVAFALVNFLIVRRLAATGGAR